MLGVLPPSVLGANVLNYQAINGMLLKEIEELEMEKVKQSCSASRLSSPCLDILSSNSC